MSKIVSIATGVPAYKHQQQDICAFADQIHSTDETESRKLRFLYRQSNIDTRYSVIPDYSLPETDRQFYSTSKDLEPFPSLEKRMDWYNRHAAPLSVTVIKDCIDGQIAPKDITHLITVSCTGMSAPGLDLEIIESMELNPNIFRTSVNFMGCYAAIHALKIANEICLNNASANVVIVCTEFCTLHFQKEPSIDNITSTILFSDGCAAMLVQHDSSDSKGLLLKKFYCAIAFKGKKDMSWKLSSKGFLMTLSGYVPDLVKEDFDTLLSKALDDTSLTKDDITHWCIHPGGRKILEAIEKSTGLTNDQLHYSYDILKDYGNMSSPSVIFVLNKILTALREDNSNKPATIFAAAFGPGLTMETFIATYD